MDLDAIEARATAATEGPWKHYPRPNSGPFAYQNEPSPIVYRDHPTPGVGLVILTADRGTEADVAFSAHARTDVPALVARVRELEEENQRLRDDLDAAIEFWIATERGRIEIRYQAAISEDCGDWWIEVPWKPLTGGRMENVDNRNVALSRARDIAKETCDHCFGNRIDPDKTLPPEEGGPEVIVPCPMCAKEEA